MKVNVFIVDDHQMFIEGLMSIFNNNEQIEVVGYALNGFDALKFIKDNSDNIDVVITDINMPEMNGIEFVSRLKYEQYDLKVICLSMYKDVSYVERIVYAGANAYLVKNTDIEVLISTILSIKQADGIIYDQEIQKNIVNKHMEEKIPDIEINYKKSNVEFTKRERQIIDFIFQGLTNNEIAQKLNLSYHTITTHRKNIYIKMGVNSFREFSDYVKMHNIQI